MQNLTKNDILTAIQTLDSLPFENESLNYGVIFEGKSYPPKLLFSTALELSGKGNESTFSLNIDEIMMLLGALGFEVFPKQDALNEEITHLIEQKEASLKFQKNRKNIRQKQKDFLQEETNKKPNTENFEIETTSFVLKEGENEYKSETDKVFSFSNGMENLFLEESYFQKMIRILKNKKNILLQGAAGVGKTFIAKRLAYTLMEEKDENRVKMIQFHQSYAYEDFIQGIRPNVAGNGFSIQKGVFMQFCEQAQQNENQAFIFIIDEINRGNLSKIFGELLMLMEADKRGKSFAMPLTYSPHENFYLPDNLYIIGTMNTADRSLALIDYALRRRFSFFEILPNFGEKWKIFCQNICLIPEEKCAMIAQKMTQLNEKIAEDLHLGKGFCIGHSYFCNENTWKNASSFEEAYTEIIEYELAPLLREYWFDKPSEAEKEIEKLYL
jgi:5-methylcytosine-specific restriction protein B